MTEKEVKDMFDKISKRYDFLNRLLSFFIDKFWRREVAKLIDSNKSLIILDIASGTGDIEIEIKKKNKDAIVFNLDLSRKMLKLAKKKLKDPILINGSAYFLPFKNNIFDFATIAFGIRNISNKIKALKEILRILKEDGKLIILEFSIPKNLFIKFFYLIYLKSFIPFIGGIFSNKNAYTYLSNSIFSFPKREEILNLLIKAGFKKAEYKDLTFGITTLYIAKK